MKESLEDRFQLCCNAAGQKVLSAGDSRLSSYGRASCKPVWPYLKSDLNGELCWASAPTSLRRETEPWAIQAGQQQWHKGIEKKGCSRTARWHGEDNGRMLLAPPETHHNPVEPSISGLPPQVSPSWELEQDLPIINKPSNYQLLRKLGLLHGKSQQAV